MFSPFLLGLGLLAVGAGVHDLGLEDAPFAVNALAAAFVGAGVVFLTGGYVLVSGRRAALSKTSARWPLAGFVAGAITGFFLFIAELRSLSVSVLVVMAALLVVAVSLLGAKVLWAQGVKLGDLGKLALAVLGTAFGLFQFWYANQYVPQVSYPAAHASASLEAASPVGDPATYRAQVTLKNEGKTRLVILASAYYITESALKPAKATETLDALARPFKTTPNGVSDVWMAQVARYSRYEREAKARVVQSGRLIPAGWYLEPGQEVSREYAVRAAPESRSILRLVAHFAVAKGDAFELGVEPSFRPKRQDSVVVSEWPVKNDSVLRWLLDGETVILVNYPVDPRFSDPGAWLAPAGARSSEEIVEFTNDAGRSIGLARTVAVAELVGGKSS